MDTNAFGVKEKKPSLSSVLKGGVKNMENARKLKGKKTTDEMLHE